MSYIPFVPNSVSKRTFLAASVSASLSACGAGGGESPAPATGVDADPALGSSAVEKGFGQIPAGNLIRILLGCKYNLLRWNVSKHQGGIKGGRGFGSFACLQV